MGVVSGIVVFILIWWLAVFTVLPWGLKRDERGMPNDPNLKRKIVITTVISAILWLVVHVMILNGVIDFRGMANQMMRQDYGS